MPRRIPITIEETLRNVLRHARMENAKFNSPGAILTPEAEKEAAETLRRVKIYMGSWVIPKLELVLRWARGDALPYSDTQLLREWAQEAN